MSKGLCEGRSELVIPENNFETYVILGVEEESKKLSKLDAIHGWSDRHITWARFLNSFRSVGLEQVAPELDLDGGLRDLYFRLNRYFLKFRRCFLFVRRLDLLDSRSESDIS